MESVIERVHLANQRYAGFPDATVYALSSWLTKLLAMSGFSVGSALNLVLATSIGGVVGALSSGWLADKLHIKWVLVACYLLTGVTTKKIIIGVVCW
jgi:cyanate permease